MAGIRALGRENARTIMAKPGANVHIAGGNSAARQAGEAEMSEPSDTKASMLSVKEVTSTTDPGEILSLILTTASGESVTLSGPVIPALGLRGSGRKPLSTLSEPPLIFPVPRREEGISVLTDILLRYRRGQRKRPK